MTSELCGWTTRHYTIDADTLHFNDVPNIYDTYEYSPTDMILNRNMDFINEFITKANPLAMWGRAI